MIVACTACQNRFEAAGYRDVTCPSCGALAQQASVRPCPRCELPLQARQVSDLVIDECSSCQGLFLDDTAIHRVLDGSDPTRAEALLASLPRRELRTTVPGGKMYIKCPTCSTVMNRKLFATGSGVVIDVCKAHGTFFDAGELPAIIEFVQRGGLVTAAKKDKQRATEYARQQQIAKNVAKEHPRTATFGGAYYASEGVALVDFLASLFE